MRRKTVKFVKHIPVYILLSFVVVLILMPLFWMFNSSFKAKVEILAYPPTFFAKAASMVNFESLPEEFRYWHMLKIQSYMLC